MAKQRRARNALQVAIRKCSFSIQYMEVAARQILDFEAWGTDAVAYPRHQMQQLAEAMRSLDEQMHSASLGMAWFGDLFTAARVELISKLASQPKNLASSEGFPFTGLWRTPTSYHAAILRQYALLTYKSGLFQFVTARQGEGERFVVKDNLVEQHAEKIVEWARNTGPPPPIDSSQIQLERAHAILLRSRFYPEDFWPYYGEDPLEFVLPELRDDGPGASPQIRIRSEPMSLTKAGRMLAPDTYKGKGDGPAAREYIKRLMKNPQSFPFERVGNKFIFDLSRFPGHVANAKH